jgi:serine/threonine protein phosphatase 1
MLWHRSRTQNANGRSRLTLPDDEFVAIYAISDIHGCCREFAEAERRIYNDGSSINGKKLIVLLGDYIDRGPDSRSVLDRLSSPVAHGYKRIMLAGNHDDEFARMYRQPAMLGEWIDFAGTETLASYGIDVEQTVRQTGLRGLHRLVNEKVDEQHIALIESFPVCLQIGKLLFVHAGVRPGVDLKRQTDTDLMWIREPFLSEGPELPIFVIHGHTPVIEPTFGRQRLAIDTAAAATGALSILKIANGEIIFL